MPVLISGGKPDHVTRPDLLDRAVPSLGKPGTGRDDQGLAQGCELQSLQRRPGRREWCRAMRLPRGGKRRLNLLRDDSRNHQLGRDSRHGPYADATDRVGNREPQ